MEQSKDQGMKKKTGVQEQGRDQDSAAQQLRTTMLPDLLKRCSPRRVLRGVR